MDVQPLKLMSADYYEVSDRNCAFKRSILEIIFYDDKLLKYLGRG